MSDDQQSLIAVDGGVDTDRGILADTAVGHSYLPYVQLYTTKSDAVTEGKIAGGHYGIVRDGNIIDLGKDVNFVFLSARGRAFHKDKDGEVTIVLITKKGEKAMDNPEYARIAALQGAKVPKAMVGPEFLIWVPTENTCATFFCGSDTLRREAKKWGSYLGGKAANLRSKIITSRDKQHKWHGPVTTDCSLKLTPLPTSEEALKEIHKFKNPPKREDKGERIDDKEKDQVVR